MSDARSRPGSPDDPEIPFIFVPHGDPEPVEWMARHPGWVKIPATLVPREAATPARQARKPHTPTPHPSWWNNPVGTEGPLFFAENAPPPGELDDVVGEWPTGKPMLRSEYNAIRNYSISLFSSLTMLDAVGRDVAAIPAENRAFSKYVGSNPPSKPQRPIAADYPNGVPSDATGRITADIEGRPLTAQNIAGRRAVDGSGEGRDWSLDPAAIESVGKNAGGAEFLGVPASRLDRKTVGQLIITKDPITDEISSAEISVLKSLSPGAADIVTAHEVGHLIDEIAGNIPTKGLNTELQQVYNRLATGEERTRHLMRPKDYGYSPDEAPREYMAEALRAYMQDPNYLKTVAPKTALVIRNYVNAHPQLKKWIQFNSAAGLGLGLDTAGKKDEP